MEENRESQIFSRARPTRQPHRLSPSILLSQALIWLQLAGIRDAKSFSEVSIGGKCLDAVGPLPLIRARCRQSPPNPDGMDLPRVLDVGQRVRIEHEQI